jgi:PhnB protein
MKHVLPYLSFDGTCREAMAFYRECLGGEYFQMTFAEGEGPGQFQVPEEAKDRLLHAALKKGDFLLMASDAMPGMPFAVGNNVAVMLVCDSDEEVDTLFEKMKAGGREVMVPGDAFWGARFAMLTDRFGINWMLSHEKVPANV